jgi:hypothetical protein
MSDLNEWLLLLRDASYELDQEKRALLADAIEDALDDAYQRGNADGYGSATEF